MVLDLHSLVVLQGLLVHIKEAPSIRQTGVGGEGVWGAHRWGHMQQVVGYRDLNI